MIAGTLHKEPATFLCGRFNDYVVNEVSAPVFPSPSPEFLCSSAHLPIHKEPATYAEAKLLPEWVQAMDEKLLALERNSTLILTSLPTRKRAIGNKWVFKIKLKPNGDIDRYKAWLVAEGYN